jgi:PAS domain S-box-containing protein/putative nucleotidyltransferase with HDIG domain
MSPNTNPLWTDVSGTVLVVDDDARNRKLLHDLLTYHGHSVQEAEDGEQALKSIERNMPDVVLMDVMMPGISGFEACQRIKSNPNTAHLPVLLVTALNERSARIKGIEAGADDFLSKPIDREEIILRVRNGILMKRLRDQLAREEALRASEARFRSLFEHHTAIMLLVDLESGRITDANSAAEVFYGYTKSELCKRKITDLDQSSSDRAAYAPNYAAFTHRLANGALRIVEAYSTPVDVQGQKLLFYIIHDITERRLAEDALRESELKFRTIIEQFAEGFTLVDSNGLCVAWNRAIEEITGIDRQQVLGKPFWEIPALFIPPNRQDPDRLEHIKRTISGATAAGEGILLNHPQDVQIQRPDGTMRSVQELVFSIKFDTGFYIASVTQDITERKQRERELQAIVSLSEALRTANTRAEMLPVILNQMVTLLDADTGTLELVDPINGDAVIELGYGKWESMTHNRIPSGEGLNSYILASGRPYLTNSVRTDPRTLDPILYGDYVAVAGAPLIAQKEIIGFLWFGRKTIISEEEVRLLAAIANIAANAIRRTTLHEQMEQRLLQLTALRKIDAAISSSLDLQITLSVLLEQTRALLKVDAADVLLLNPHLHMLEFNAGQGFRSRKADHILQGISEGYAGRSVLQRTTISIPNLAAAENEFPISEHARREGFVAYQVTPLIAKGQVKGVLEVYQRETFAPDPDWLNFMETLAQQASIAIDNTELFQRLGRSNIDLQLAYDATIEGWSRALDLRDKETEDHSKRVSDLTEFVAKAIGMNDADLVHIRRGALLHDIGKMGIPDYILLKPGPLTLQEMEIVHRHPIYSYELLSPIAYLRPAIDIPYCHHEKWDGSGYPRHLKGEQIPLAARIFTVVDVWDAMTSERPYHPKLSKEVALAYITSEKGKHFDPHVVDVFLACISEDK